MENTDNQIIGAIKIKDGLFIGDEFASQDLEFIVTNKVTHIINCSSKEVSNAWESIGVSYLSFPWDETDDQIIFDEKNEIVNEIFRFIEETSVSGESCLVHSVRGQSRSCCVLAAFFMRKYRWSLYKTLEYLNSRRPDLEIRASFFHQLNDLENRLCRMGLGAKSSNWNEAGENHLVDTEELVIRNTFLNSKNMPLSEIYMNQNFYLNKTVKPKIFWIDENAKKNNNNLQNFLKDKKDVFNKPNNENCNYIKSILKGSNKVFAKQTKFQNETLEKNEKKSPMVFGPYLKMNKSSKSLIEESSLKISNNEEKKPMNASNYQWNKPPMSMKETLSKSSLIQEPAKGDTGSTIKDFNLMKFSNASMSRSSSLKAINKEDSKDSINEANEKKNNEINPPNTFSTFGTGNNGQKESFLPNGNSVIHVTVNNFVNSPTINNMINKYNFQNRTIKDENEKNNIDNASYSVFSKRNEKTQNFSRSSSKNNDEENLKKQNTNNDAFLSSKASYKLEFNKEKSGSNSSFLNDFNENKKKIASRREHDSVSPLPTRGKSSSPPKELKEKKPLVMNESVYSKTLLKRFQNSLKEKPYENTYLKSLKDPKNANKQNDQENDVSPLRKVYNATFASKVKPSDNSYNDQKTTHSNRISNTLNSRKAGISPLNNNMNVNNLIHSVTSYQISTKNSTNPTSNSNSNNYSGLGNINVNNKNGPIRPTHERKDLSSMLIPNKQIFITSDAENEHFSSLNNELKKKNNSETNPLNRPGSAPFRYYSPSAKMVIKSTQRSITPISSTSENNQPKPRLRSSSPSSNLSQNQNQNQNTNSAINTSLQNNLFVYTYNSAAYQNKPKWKF